MKQISTFFMFSVLIVGSACSSKSQEESNEVSEQVQPSASTTNSYTAPQMSTDEQPYQSSSPSNNSSRSDAFQLAFNTGKQLGYSDGLKGINDCYSAASAYTDDWIKQAFIQGYEMGQAEAGSYSSAVEYDEDEYEYDDGGYYYDDEY
jgi:hypothetical protein